MAAKMQLNILMANMFATGMLDDQFKQLQMLQEESGQDLLVEIITLFCKQSKWIIDELGMILNKPYVDFNKVSALLYRLQGSSASVGAQRVKNTCIQFHKYCQENTRYGCLNTLDVIRNELCDLHIKLHTMFQLEKHVRTIHPKE